MYNYIWLGFGLRFFDVLGQLVGMVVVVVSDGMMVVVGYLIGSGLWVVLMLIGWFQLEWIVGSCILLILDFDGLGWYCVLVVLS